MALKQITAKDFKDAVSSLTNGYTCWHKLLGRTDAGTELVFVIGWSDAGYDEDDAKQNGYADGRYTICSKIACQSRYNGSQSDYDGDFEMPYDKETGDVWDTDTMVSNNESDWEADAATYNKDAQAIWDTYCVPDEDGFTALDALFESKKSSEAKKSTCSMQKKKESLAAKKNEDNGKEYITEWQADIIKGLEKVKDKYGLVIEYNGPFSDEWKEYPTYSVFVRKGGKKEDIGAVGTDYVHAFVEYSNPGMNVSRPHKAKDYSAEEAIQVILNSADMCLGKKGESKKPACSMQKKKESLSAKKSKKCEGLMDDLPYDAPVAIESLCSEIMSHTEAFTIEDADVAEMCGKWYIRDYANGSTAAHNEDEFVDEVLAGLSGSPVDGSPFGAAEAEGYARKIYNEVVA